MLLEDNAAAYIVRVWLEHREVEDAPVTWRGSIEHVASGRVRYLTDLDEIARVIRPHLEAMGVVFDESAWRGSLEDRDMGSRVGFADLPGPAEYLQLQTEDQSSAGYDPDGQNQ